VTTPHSPNIRIGDSEREDAIKALGEHYTAGRLDIDEYGERTAKVTAARVRADIYALFADLPEPQPTLSPAAQPAGEAVAPPVPARFRRRQVASATVGLAWLGAIALMILLRNHYVIFIPLALTIVFGAAWGSDRRYGRRRRYRD
jgi:hypothetical protein